MAIRSKRPNLIISSQSCDTNKQPTLKPKISTELKLFITLPNEKTINVYIPKRNDSVLNLKDMIANKSNIPIETQKIVYQARTLLNGKSLRYYDIQNLSELTVIADCDPLAALLSEYNLYGTLYKILADNHIDLEMLKNDIKPHEIDEFSKGLGFNITQKLKFEKLMRYIALKQGEETKSNAERKMDQPYNDSMRIALVGDCGVGKTCLMWRYVEGNFFESSELTIGVDFAQTYETLTDDTIMKMQIWDTAGQEKYQSVATTYYRTTDVIIVCFDVGRDVTLEHCAEWKLRIDNYGKDDVIVIFVGCKGDLSPASRKSVEEQAQDIMERYGKFYCECSAKTGENVRNVFLTAAEMVMQQRTTKKETAKLSKQIDLDRVPRSRHTQTHCGCV